MKELLTFDDVLIKPRFSKIKSRKDVNLSTHIRGLDISFPLISANMDTVTGHEMAEAMLNYGAQACIHRFGSIQDTVDTFLKTNYRRDGAMVSIGLGTQELERAEAMFKAGGHTFVVDVAHGAQLSVAEQVLELRKIVGPYSNVIVGNFATGESVKDFLEYTGNTVDGIKVGIGPGSACTTRIKTGVGIPQLSAVMDVVGALRNTEIVVIADGGLKKPGDIAKALGAGAHMVMVGGMLAGTEETPGEVIEKATAVGAAITGEWTKYKKYRGSASQESYDVQGKNATHRTAEGESFLVPYKGPVADVLQDIEGGLRSSFCYVGARNLKEFHARVEFVRISPSTVVENGSHGKKTNGN